RSLGAVGRRALDRAVEAGVVRDVELAEARAWVATWRTWLAGALLGAYRERTAGSPFSPADDAVFATLLDAYLIDDAFDDLARALAREPGRLADAVRGAVDVVQA
ncbi:MAG TPA: hypothetical protein VNJ28_08400, partial [Candidatus Limnocylindrales bacterium]|nr:hypothetical protein [Candidatus Limnocylindrales bacterium]